MSDDGAYTDRYQALGIAYPDASTVCHGECEGTGWVPVRADDRQYAAAWALAEAEHPSDDGWHFVQCAECAGTGKQR